jgi:hypothetical protein
MFAFLLLLLLTAAQPALASLPGGNLKITPEMARFNYRPFEEGEALACEHQLKDPAAQDWEVSCGDQKKYVVHLWVTAYTHESEPRMSYEILYWVTDMSRPDHTSSSGATTWVHLKDPSALAAIETRQSVDNDTAGLYLELRFP